MTELLQDMTPEQRAQAQIELDKVARLLRQSKFSTENDGSGSLVMTPASKSKWVCFVPEIHKDNNLSPVHLYDLDREDRKQALRDLKLVRVEEVN